MRKMDEQGKRKKEEYIQGSSKMKSQNFLFLVGVFLDVPSFIIHKNVLEQRWNWWGNISSLVSKGREISTLSIAGNIRQEDAAKIDIDKQLKKHGENKLMNRKWLSIQTIIRTQSKQCKFHWQRRAKICLSKSRDIADARCTMHRT